MWFWMDIMIRRWAHCAADAIFGIEYSIFVYLCEVKCEVWGGCSNWNTEAYLCLMSTWYLCSSSHHTRRQQNKRRPRNWKPETRNQKPETNGTEREATRKGKWWLEFDCWKLCVGKNILQPPVWCWNVVRGRHPFPFGSPSLHVPASTTATMVQD